MPNIKSQKKRALTNMKRNAAVTSKKSALKTSIKHVRKAIEAGDKEAATVALNGAYSSLDSALSSGIHHKNYVQRQKSRLSAEVNALD